MTKKKPIDLNKFTDSEILAAMLALPVSKFVRVMNGIDQSMKRAQKRGMVLGRENSESIVSDMMRQLEEDDESKTSEK